MSFTSALFAIFVCIVFPILGVLGERHRILFLTVASYVFYSASYPPWVVILFSVTFVDYHLARLLDRTHGIRSRRLLVVASCAVNLGLLGFFKYAGFFAGMINDLASALHIAVRLPVYTVQLPLGISFFVFESLSYMIDIYRRRMPPAKSFSEYALFIAFFPHLIAGPIVRAHDFLPQLGGFQPFAADKTIAGLELVGIGFFKKVVVADNLAPLVEKVYSNPNEYYGGMMWLATVFFAIQIYSDFSGYTDIARGLARMMGIELNKNFYWPYLSWSFRVFWQRWHISLSSWLRDYLYIPLGGSRHGVPQTAAAIFVTWLLGGLWHGAAWHFVVWGLYHGALVTSGNLIMMTSARRVVERVPTILCVVWTFTLVTLGWVLFRASSLETALGMLGKMVGLHSRGFFLGVPITFSFAALCLPPLLALHVVAYRIYGQDDRYSLCLRMPYWVRSTVLAMLFLICVFFAGNPATFIYFQF